MSITKPLASFLPKKQLEERVTFDQPEEPQTESLKNSLADDAASEKALEKSEEEEHFEKKIEEEPLEEGKMDVPSVKSAPEDATEDTDVQDTPPITETQME